MDLNPDSDPDPQHLREGFFGWLAEYICVLKKFKQQPQIFIPRLCSLPGEGMCIGSLKKSAASGSEAYDHIHIRPLFFKF